MKKIYIAMAVLATAALTSCQQEKPFNDLSPIGENGIAFTINGAASTRAAEIGLNVQKGATIPVGSDEAGNAYYLEEEIMDLNPTGPATKGTPAYTVNVGKIYKNMGVKADGKFGDTSFEVMDWYDHMDEEQEINGKGWRYHHNYTGDPWPDKTTPVDFYFRMPVEDTNREKLVSASKKTSFSYVSPLKGSEQLDILFAHTSISKEKHNEFLPYGAPVTMYHALSGVKFRVGNDNTGATKTIITKVELSGLYASGDCEITFGNGNPTIDWKNLGTNNVTFEQGFENPTYDKDKGKNNSDGTVSTTGDTDHKWNSDLTGTTWTSAAADNNLNDKDGSLTFWFIPQAMNDKVKLKVTFCIKTPDTAGDNGGGVITHEIELGKGLSGVKWEAGQLRTYTLVPKEVDVEIYDTMDGNTKSKLRVTNTGNVHEYVRMTFLGNWYDKDGNIVVGYTSDGKDGKNEMVLPWYGAGYPCTDPTNPSTIDLSKLNDDSYTGPRIDPYGYFDETFLLAKLGSDSKWVRASGGYYYTEAIGPGTKLDPVTQALFQSYTLTSVPKIYVPSTEHDYRVEAEGVHLVMEVAVQAIYAPMNEDGTEETSTWKQEWYEATGNPKLKP